MYRLGMHWLHSERMYAEYGGWVMCWNSTRHSQCIFTWRINKREDEDIQINNDNAGSLPWYKGKSRKKEPKCELKRASFIIETHRACLFVLYEIETKENDAPLLFWSKLFGLANFIEE